MRVFKHFPKKEACPICKTNKDKECVLIGINSTEEDNIIQAQVFHLNCLELRYIKERNIIYQTW